MTILLGECCHIKSCWNNHNRCIKCSSCSRKSTCSTCSSWSDRTWKLGSWLRRRRDHRKPCLIHQTKKIGWDHHPTWPYCPGEDPSRWQLQGYLYPEVCKHRPPAIRPVDKKTSLTSHQSLATGQMGITQEFSSQSITVHWPSSHRSLDLENINTEESQYSPATGHRSSDFIPTYI